MRVRSTHTALYHAHTTDEWRNADAIKHYHTAICILDIPQATPTDYRLPAHAHHPAHY